MGDVLRGHTTQIEVGQSVRRDTGEKAFSTAEDKRTAVCQQMLQILRAERCELVINTLAVSEG